MEYLWKPAKCTKCKVFGHADDRCIRTQVENIVQSSIEQQVQNSDEEWKTIVAKGKRKVGEPSSEVSDIARQDGGQVDCGVQEVPVTGILSEVEIAASIEVTDVARQHGDRDVCKVQEVPITGSLSEIVKPGSEEPESILDPSEPDPEIQANSLSLEEEVADRVMLTQRMLRSAAKPAAPKAIGSSSSRRKKKRIICLNDGLEQVAQFGRYCPNLLNISFWVLLLLFLELCSTAMVWAAALLWPAAILGAAAAMLFVLQSEILIY